MDFYLKIKYLLAFFYKKYFFKSTPFEIKNFEKKNKLIICGNGPSLKDYENSKSKSLLEADHLILNRAIMFSKISPKIHIFELSEFDDVMKMQLKFIEAQKIFPDLTIFRPSRKRKNLLHLKYNHMIFFDELRIRYNNDKNLIKDLKKIKSKKILFARNSIIYSVILAIKLGYRNIEFIGINPENPKYFYTGENNEKHTANIGEFGISPLDLLKKIIEHFEKSGINFKVSKYNNYDFLKK